MLYKRNNTWWVRFTTPNGTRIRRSAKTSDKIAAQEFHDTLKAQVWRTVTLQEKQKHSWKEAVVRWLQETSHKKSHEDDKLHLRWVDQHAHDMMLEAVNRDFVDHITSKRLDDGVSNATVNRMLEVVRAILRRSEREWEWLEKAPFIRMLPESKRRIRWITREEAQRLLMFLPEHLKATVRFSLATGLRKSNVTNLQWSQLDLVRGVAWIHADQAKAGRSLHVPLSNEARDVIKSQIGKHELYVFTYRGNPIKEVNTKAFKKALARAGITNFRWHDLRHTWASWHIQQGTPIAVLQELGGWESSEMVRRYAHLGNEHTFQYANQLSLEVTPDCAAFGTNLAQNENVLQPIKKRNQLSH